MDMGFCEIDRKGRTFVYLAHASRVVHWYVILHELGIELLLL